MILVKTYIAIVLALMFASAGLFSMSSIAESKKIPLILGDPENNPNAPLFLPGYTQAASASAVGPGAYAAAGTRVTRGTGIDQAVEASTSTSLSDTSLEFVDVATSSEPFVQSSLETIKEVVAAAYPQYKMGMSFYAQPEMNTVVYPERWGRMLANIDFTSADTLLDSLVNGQKYVSEATFSDKEGNKVVLVITATHLLQGGVNSAYTVWGYSFSPTGTKTDITPIEIRRNGLGQMVFFQAGESTL